MNKPKKQSYSVMQDALFNKGANGLQPMEAAKEGMTTLKKNSTKLTVICTDNSEDEIKAALKENEIPFDNTIKIEPAEIYIFGKNSNNCNNWLDMLNNLGYQLSRGENKNEDLQKKADSSFSSWFKKQEKNCL